MKRFVILIAVLMAGCVAVDASKSGPLELELSAGMDEYRAASQAMDDVIARSDGDSRQQLMKFRADADAIVAEIYAAWQSDEPITAERAGELYRQARQVYTEAERAILPVLPFLSQDDIYLLSKLKSRAERIDRTYSRLAYKWGQQKEAMQAGIELAILAMKMGVITL